MPSSREHGTTAITYLYYRPGVAPSAQLALAQTYAQRIRAQGDPVTGVTGTIPAREAEFRQIEHALPYVEAATIALIALILLIAFRAIGPPLVTLGAAVLSYAISVRLLTWIAEGLGVQVPREVQPVLVALLLGLTTDYSVFFFSGVKRSLASGERRVRAAEQTTRLFLPIIVTAGLIVAFGSASLIVGRLGFFRALGPGMAVTVLVTLAVAVTVIPATLATAAPSPGLRLSERTRRRACGTRSGDSPRGARSRSCSRSEPPPSSCSARARRARPCSASTSWPACPEATR